jgi:hypothetical protein
MPITRRCKSCLKDIELPCTEDQVLAWRNGRDLIQRALPQLTADERELLLSGYCGSCFDSLFALEEEEDKNA